MIKIPPRTKKDYGNGPGSTTYESERFLVKLWNRQHGVSTAVKCNNLFRYTLVVTFDGDHSGLFTTDEACVQAFPPDMLLKMMDCAHERGMVAGRIELRDKFRDLMKV